MVESWKVEALRILRKTGKLFSAKEVVTHDFYAPEDQPANLMISLKDF